MRWLSDDDSAIHAASELSPRGLAMSFSRPKHAKVGWLAALSPRFLATPSVMVLIAANLLPLAGVLFWGWDLFTLMMLYWAETGVIGFFAIIQMAILARWRALFYVPFFVLHFGGFMIGHFLFLAVTFGRGSVSSQVDDLPNTIPAAVDERGLWLALGALFASHGISFVLNVLVPLFRNGRGSSLSGGDAPTSAMLGVYGRVMVMHVTIIIGAVLSQLFGSPLAAFVLLISLKIVVDVAAHVRKNFSLANPRGSQALA